MKPFQAPVKILATGRYSPEKVVTNDDLAKIVETSDEWIYSRTGIKERHFVESDDTSDLAVKAVRHLLSKTPLDLEDVDLIVCATFSPDLKSPGVSSLVQEKLGLGHKSITTFDLNAACSGFVYALGVVSALLQTGSYQNALVIGAEVISKVTDFTDRNTCVLFGDGAGCVWLQPGSPTDYASFYPLAKGDPESALYVNQYVHMDGQKVYHFAVRAIETILGDLSRYEQIPLDSLRLIIPHQANRRIVLNAAKTLNLPVELFFMNMESYGNTSAASVPIALDEAIEQNRLSRGDKFAMVAFGAGFTYAACFMTY